MSPRNFFGSKGFTLVELLTVIAIIGILSTIVMTSLLTARKKGRDVKRIADIKQIQLALEQYYNDNLKYPPNIYSGGYLNPAYMPVVPKDPLEGGNNCGGNSNGQYCYTAFNAAAAASTNCVANIPVKYHLAAVLEIAGNQGSGVYAQTAGAAQNSGNACSSSAPAGDFNGISTGCTTSGANGSAGGATTCYDVVNQ